MNSLEERLLKYNAFWVWHQCAFTTVVAGHAFALYRENGLMRLCGLTKKDTANQLEIHKTKSPAVTGCWAPRHGSYQDRMFDTVASDEFVAQVIRNAFPELEI